MKVKFTYRRAGGRPVDLMATLDSNATIGDLAEHLRVADPAGYRGSLDGRVTLTLVDRQNVMLDPDLLVADSGFHSGSNVSLGQAGTMYAGASATAAAKIRVIAGPDVGKEFRLPQGSVTIGRDTTCDVVLTDRLASRKHARINITDVAEVIDLGSANGVTVGTATVPRATLRPGDVVGIGDTELIVEMLVTIAVAATEVSGFNRSPRIEPRYDGREFEVPEAPERRAGRRFPLIALLAPLLMGGVLFTTTGHHIESLAFVALSPLMLIGNYAESTLTSKRDFKRAVQAFDAELGEVRELMAAELVVERAARLEEHPGGRACLEAIDTRSPLLWSRRSDAPAFGELSFGLGTLPSRSTLEFPRGKRGTVALKERAKQALEPLRIVEGVPVSLALGSGAVGVAGPRSVSLGLVRSLVLQAVALHSPAELVLTAVLSTQTSKDWEWLTWLPHSSSAHSPVPGRQLVSLNTDVVALLVELENLLDERRAAKTSSPAVFVLVESDAAVEHARMTVVAEQGAALGVHVLWMAADVTLLPAACKAFASLDPAQGPGRVGFVRTATEVVPVEFDGVTLEQVQHIARRLAPLYDASAVVADDSDLPHAVSQFALLGSELGTDSGAVIERWQQNSSIVTGPYAPAELPRKAGTLRAVVGQSPVGQHALDLRTDGPHALVGGTTGAGKSELLQSWILAMATAHSPQRVNFLLVDYKGGSAFSECVDLPHCIGLVTDLSPHMVRRALTSLRAELRYREELLAEHDAKDLQALESQGFVGAPPSLVIVVDEFAALANDVPEFVDGMVDVAQRGRSLGLHLILATQRPAGVIKNNLRANTNLRLALRMADGADSTDILGTAVAAGFDPGTPGRAMSKSGPNRLVPFQAAYAGGWTTESAERPDVDVEELTLGAVQAWEAPRAVVVRDKEQTDIKRVVRVVRDANRVAALPVPRRAWMPVLPETQHLLTIHRQMSDESLFYALSDNPERQSQPPVSFDPDRHGSMVVYGTGGAGKSTFLRTMGVAAGLTLKGGPCWVYGLDFGSRGLSMLEGLPHVGSIIAGSDFERLSRLVKWLRAEIEDRAVRYSAVNAGTITAYRSIAGRPDEPRILLLIDGIAAFRSTYEGTDRARWYEAVAAIASEGRPVGVHVVLSCETRSGVGTTLSSAVQQRLVLRMTTDDDYQLLGVPGDILDARAPAGRGLLGELEVQVAVHGGNADPVEQARHLTALAQDMRQAGVTNAPPILRLPDLVRREEISGDALVLGLASEDLQPVALEPRGAFLVAGPSQSGRTTTLGYLARSLRRADPHRELIYFGSRRSMLADASWWTATAFGADEIGPAATELAKRVVDGARVAVFVESAGDLANSPADMPLTQLAKACVAEDQWLVVEGEASTLNSMSGFLGTAKNSRTGIALQPDQDVGNILFKTPFPRVARHEFPVGRGLHVSGGKARVVQVAFEEATGG